MAGPNRVRPHRADYCHSGQAALQLLITAIQGRTQQGQATPGRSCPSGQAVLQPSITAIHGRTQQGQATPGRSWDFKVFTDRDFKVFTDRDFKVFTDRDFKVFTDHTLLLWRSCEVPKTGTELATMLGLDPELGSTHFCMGTVFDTLLLWRSCSELATMLGLDP